MNQCYYLFIRSSKSVIKIIIISIIYKYEKISCIILYNDTEIPISKSEVKKTIKTNNLISKPNKKNKATSTYCFIHNFITPYKQWICKIHLIIHVHRIVRWPHQYIDPKKKKTPRSSMHMKNTVRPIDVFLQQIVSIIKKPNTKKPTQSRHTHGHIGSLSEWNFFAKTKGHNWHFFSPFDRHVKLSPSPKNTPGDELVIND